MIQNNPDIDDSSLPNFRKALSNGDAVTRIHVFGSYPNYSPLVFDAVLAPVAKQWAATGGGGHEAFWQWRRCRPLTAALPMGDAERLTMVKGWFVGQIVGQYPRSGADAAGHAGADLGPRGGALGGVPAPAAHPADPVPRPQRLAACGAGVDPAGRRPLARAAGDGFA